MLWQNKCPAPGELGRVAAGKRQVPWSCPGRAEGGFSLLETLVTLAIFSIISAGVFSAYISQLKHSSREFKLAESGMELEIATGLMARDLRQAGFGLAHDYSVDATIPTPTAMEITNGNPDELVLMGTALGYDTRATQGWTHITSAAPTLNSWADVREDLSFDDRVILMEPNTRKLLGDGGKWLFRYRHQDDESTAGNRLYNLGTGAAFGSPVVGTLAYGVYDASLSADDTDANLLPYHAVKYYLDATDPPVRLPSACAPGTVNLFRAESNKTIDPTETPASDPIILSCVLDLQYSFDLDTSDDGSIDDFDDGGTTAATYDAQSLRNRLKLTRVYLLVQSGKRDAEYTYPAASVRVGNTGLGLGRDINLTTEQRRYRWQLVTLKVAPENLR